MRGTFELLLVAYAAVLCRAGTPFSNVVATPNNNRTNIFKARVKQVGSGGMLGELGGVVENNSLAGIRGLSVSIQNGMLSNLQVFSEGLGGIKAPDIVQSKDAGKPFAVNGEGFADFSSAASQTCKIQYTACSEKAKQSGENNGKASANSAPKDKPKDKPSAKSTQKPGNKPADKPVDKPGTGAMRMGKGGNGQKEGKTPPKPGGKAGNNRRAILNGTSVDGSPHGAPTSADSSAALAKEAEAQLQNAPDAPLAQPASSDPSTASPPGPQAAPEAPGQAGPAASPAADAAPASPPLPPQLPPPLPPGPEVPAPVPTLTPNRVQDPPANKAAAGDGLTADACQQQMNRCNAALKSAPFQSFTLENVGPDPSMPDFDLLCGGPA